MSLKHLLPAPLLLALAVSPPVTAGTITLSDNLLNDNANSAFIFNNSWGAQAFTTTATAYTLSSVTAKLRKEGGATGNFAVQIYDNTGGGANQTPGNKVADVATVSASSLSSSYANYEINNLSIVLDPSTQYFLVFKGINLNDLIYWSLTSNSVGTGFPANYDFTNNEGVQWLTDWRNSFFGQMQIVATEGGGTVPEPGSLGLLLTGLAALGLSKRQAKAS